jgi:hypothetical protein
MERIARETEEDYQKLIALLESFGCQVLRPNVSDDHKFYLDQDGKIAIPPMCPRDYAIMLGNDFFFKTQNACSVFRHNWNVWRGDSWPAECPDTVSGIRALPDFIKQELYTFTKIDIDTLDLGLSVVDQFTWGTVVEEIAKHTNQVCVSKSWHIDNFNSADTTRIGKDVYLGTHEYCEDPTEKMRLMREHYPNYRWHSVDTGGHSDGTYCPVTPGLIVSLKDIPEYSSTFPGWEVIYLPGQSWGRVRPFLELKEKNKGKWWVPGEELNDDFTDFVEEWLGHWVGYVEETVFDVNMLVIDKKNVVCNNYNKEVFDAFERRGITPHIVNFRHRFFWDGGLHCVTLDIHREGTQEDYFPERG